MKMTPEQKAYEEYGFEKGCLRKAIKIIRRQVWQFHRVRYGELNLSTRREIWHKYRLKFIVERIRVKRAVCKRLQTEKRTCWTCASNGTSVYYEPCNKCFRYGSDRQFDNWEPRKEGE